jgi:hypothetical protein
MGYGKASFTGLKEIVDRKVCLGVVVKKDATIGFSWVE